MCPECIASTAVMVAGAGSAGGILALCIDRFRKIFESEWQWVNFSETDPLAVPASSDSLANRGPLGRR
jgi:hypothetical protein